VAFHAPAFKLLSKQGNCSTTKAFVTGALRLRSTLFEERPAGLEGY